MAKPEREAGGNALPENKQLGKRLGEENQWLSNVCSFWFLVQLLTERESPLEEWSEKLWAEPCESRVRLEVQSLSAAVQTKLREKAWSQWYQVTVTLHLFVWQLVIPQSKLNVALNSLVATLLVAFLPHAVDGNGKPFFDGPLGSHCGSRLLLSPSTKWAHFCEAATTLQWLLVCSSASPVPALWHWFFSIFFSL